MYNEDMAKKLREESGVSQQAVAKSVNITQQHYNFIENGERSPSPRIAKKSPKYYKLTLIFHTTFWFSKPLLMNKMIVNNFNFLIMDRKLSPKL